MIRLLNVSYGELRHALRAFDTEVQEADIALIYYAGHDIELADENWLVPINIESKADTDVPNEAISLKTRELGLVILDACRDNPFVAKMGRSS